MERDDPAGAGLIAGTVVGLLTAAIAVGSLLLFRERVLRDLETALEAAGADVGMSVTAVFWLSVVAAGLFRIVLGLVAGSLVGVVYGWLDRSNLAVLIAMVFVLGALDGLTANIGASRLTTVVAYTAAWVCYVPVFDRVYADAAETTTAVAEATRSDEATGSAAAHPEEAVRGLTAVDRRLAALLVALGLLGTVAGVPYVAALNDVPIGTATLSMVLTNGVLTAGAVVVGLRLAPRAGFELPAFERLLDGRLPDVHLVSEATVAGLAVGVALVALDLGIAATAIGADATPDVTVAAWQRALAALYGGLFEEVLLRLGLLTAVVWAMVRLSGRDAPTGAQVWGAIVAVALVFGAAHLPVAVGITGGLSAAVVGRILLLNGIAGVVFGWLYWSRGLLAAMVAHLAANVVLQVLAPAVLSV